MMGSQAALIIEIARVRGRPPMFQDKEAVARGALASYGVSYYGAGRLSAKQVQRVLLGASPADLPVEQIDRLAFVINRNGLTYSGPLDEAKVVDRLATSCGHWGSGADYLYNTVKNLEERGIHDRHLWRLQRLVAERITALNS